MFDIGGYVLAGILTLAGLSKWRKIVPILKDIRSLLRKYDEVTKKESANGERITEGEWKILAKEALKLVQDIAAWWSWRSQNR